MDRFKVRFKVCSVREPERCREVEGVVDTGATVSVIPKEILQELEIAPSRPRVFTLADGSKIERTVSGAILKIKVDGKEYETFDEVLFGEKGDEIILGVTALEHLGIKVDSKRGKLIKEEPHI